MIRLLSIALFISIAQKVDAQSDYLVKTDTQLADSFRLFYTNPFGENSDSLRSQLKKRVVEVLQDEKSFDFPFDSLSQYMRVIQSKDKKIRIFSWDQLSGGNWHDIASIAQFKTDSGEVKVKDLVLEDDGTTYFTDVINYEIHQINYNKETYYLIIGSGTHGSGQHHKIAQLFMIKGNSLVRLINCFDKKDILIQEIPRRFKVKLDYDAKTQTITYEEFEDKDEDSFADPTGNLITLKFTNGVFIKE